MEKKILQITDLHMEKNNNIPILNQLFENKIADIIVLTGDIDNGFQAINFIEKLLENNYIVIYILGNNEFYNFSIDNIINGWRELSLNYKNFYFLEGDNIVIDNINFIGTCLWTSVGTSHCNENINKDDFHFFKDIYKFELTKNFDCLKMKNLFYSKVQRIDTLLSESNSKYNIVLSHYLPSYKSIAPQYRQSKFVNMFASDIEWLFYKHDIDFWFHGHTHTKVKYKLNDTEIICNPLGRKEDKNEKFSLIEGLIKVN